MKDENATYTENLTLPDSLLARSPAGRNSCRDRLPTRIPVQINDYFPPPVTSEATGGRGPVLNIGPRVVR